MIVKRKYIIGALSLLTLGIGLACKKVIQVDLHDAASRVVIEGEITNVPGPYQVKISRSVVFSDPNVFPPVRGASVVILDSTNGNSYTLTESAPGIYTTNDLQGTPKHTYRLLVNTDSQQFTAISTMPGTVHLDSVSFAMNIGYNGKEDINAIINFQDPPGLGNYYQFIEYINGRLIPDIFVFEDRLSDGRYIEEPLFNDSNYLHKGDTLAVKMYCVDQSNYNYFFTLQEISNNNGGFQTASPANPNTNLTGGALGYFSAHTINEEKLAVY
jgi:hypothetical protein